MNKVYRFSFSGFPYKMGDLDPLKTVMCLFPFMSLMMIKVDKFEVKEVVLLEPFDI